MAAAAVVGTRLYWYRARAARPQGPLRMERLRELWLQGGLDAHSLIWCEAWPHWKPVSQVPELSAGVPRAHRPPSLTPTYSLAAEEQAWGREMRALRERVRRVAGADPEDARPTRELPSVAPAGSLGSRQGRLLLAGAVVAPALLGLCLSAAMVLHPGPRVPEPVLSLVRCLFTWAEHPPARIPERPAAARAPLAPPTPPALLTPPAPVKEGSAERRVDQARVIPVSGVLPVPPANRGLPQCREGAAVLPTMAQAIEDRLDRDFERELGFAPDSPAKPAAPVPQRTVYLPPEPETGPRETLSTADIVQGVLAHKQAVLACLRKHAPRREHDEDKARLVVRWRVLPAGTVSEVAVEDEALQGTPLAGCLEEQVRSWTFPRHRVASREPVRFPFVY